jgi:hypothetical protein
MEKGQQDVQQRKERKERVVRISELSVDSKSMGPLGVAAVMLAVETVPFITVLEVIYNHDHDHDQEPLTMSRFMHSSLQLQEGIRRSRRMLWKGDYADCVRSLGQKKGLRELCLHGVWLGEDVLESLLVAVREGFDSLEALTFCIDGRQEAEEEEEEENEAYTREERHIREEESSLTLAVMSNSIGRPSDSDVMQADNWAALVQSSRLADLYDTTWVGGASTSGGHHQAKQRVKKDPSRVQRLAEDIVDAAKARIYNTMKKGLSVTVVYD